MRSFYRPGLKLAQRGLVFLGNDTQGSRAALGMLLWICLTPISLFADDGLATEFLQEYCVACHGGDEPAGERSFEQLGEGIDGDDTAIDYRDILDQLNLGAMPPEDEQQPTISERQRVVELLSERLKAYQSQLAATTNETVLRRLSAREYRNTIRDLLALNTTMFDPTVKFPRDQMTHHLDNVGSELVTSAHLLVRYLEAAESIVDKAMYPLEKPEVQTWRFEDNLHQQPEIDQVHRKTNHFGHLTLYDVIGADKHEGAYAPIHDFAEGVPYDGYYEMRFKASALYRDHPYDDSFLKRDRSEPLRLGIVAGNRLAGPLHKPQPMEPLLAELSLDDGKHEYVVRIWLDRGFTPRFTYPNGLMDARNLWSKVQKKYPDLFPKPRRSGIVEARYIAIAHGKLPQIQVDDIEIRGPLYDVWPTPSQRALLGEDWEAVARSKEIERGLAIHHLKRFMGRAYRRPVTDDEVQRVAAGYDARLAAGRDSLEAFRDMVTTILCAPSFLYLDEGDQLELSQWALASRLSYLIWGSQPDSALLACAEQGELTDSKKLVEQLHRLLDDDRAEGFVTGFLDSWLTLRDLGATPPDRDAFRDFYQFDLGRAMRQETELFMKHLLQENLSIEYFLDADFAFVNKALARHYELKLADDVQFHGGEFQRVQLQDRRRGGLLGQASVLTVTANGIDTSPVVRGVWVLENILGMPPSPPPPDVEPLDPDVRGAKSIREQLEKHRELATCQACHRKIDPLGFAMENYDPIGRWRDRYDNKVPVDAKGQMPDGRTFHDIRGLKDVLSSFDEQFARALTEKLLAYAIGRELNFADAHDVDMILARLQERGGGFRDLVELVVDSGTFRRR